MISGVEFSDSSLSYNTQCSSQQVPSLMPITPLAHPPTDLPCQQPSVCSLYLRVSYGLSPSPFLCYFASLPLCSSVLYLKFHLWMKSYDVCLSDLFHLAWYPLVPSTLLQMARFHSFWLLSNIPSYIYTTSLSLHQSVDIWALSILWLLPIVLL